MAHLSDFRKQIITFLISSWWTDRMSLASPYNSYLVDYNPGTPPATPLTSLPYSPHPQTPFQVTEYTSEGLFSSIVIHIDL